MRDFNFDILNQDTLNQEFLHIVGWIQERPIPRRPVQELPISAPA